MKRFVVVCLLICSIRCAAQTVCGTATENSTLTLTAPAGNVFTSINFASYGTPNGSCGSFTVSSCHSATSLSVCNSVFVGRTSASVSADNGVFGDPCVGTVKRLSVQAQYSAIVPLRLLAFAASDDAGATRLTWQTADEIRFSNFVVEKSSDGLIFDSVAAVEPKNGSTNYYSFTDRGRSQSLTQYYRLKMLDADGSFRLSGILRVTANTTAGAMNVYPNPAANTMVITGKPAREGFIVNSAGQIVKRLQSAGGTVFVNTEGLAPGLYFVKCGDATTSFLRK